MSIPRNLLLILLTLLEVLSEVMIRFSDLVENFRNPPGITPAQKTKMRRRLARHLYWSGMTNPRKYY